MQCYIALQSTFLRAKLQEHYEIINQSKFVMEQLRLEQVIVIMDQALYANATEIAWKHTSIHGNVVGTFHTIVNLLVLKGKRFQNVGMRDILIVPGIIAECTISGVS